MKKILEWLRALPWASAAKAALQIIVPAAIGSGAAILAGCSDLRPSAKTRFARAEGVGLPEREARTPKGPQGAETMGVYAFGIPGIAFITHSTQDADNSGDDENKPVQHNPIDVKTAIK